MLSRSDRSNLRRALARSGVRSSGLTDEELEALAREHDVAIAEAEPTPEPEPERDAEYYLKGKHEPRQDKPRRAPPPAPASGLDSMLHAMIQDTVSQAIAALGTEDLDESRIIDLIREHASQTIHISHSDERPERAIQGAHEALPTVLATLRAAKVTGSGWPFLVGPAGSGKTTLGLHAAEALDVPFYPISAVHQKYELTGFVDAGGNYQATPLYHAMLTGGVFLFDELDDSIPGAVVAFNSALANGVYTFPNGETVRLHKDAYFLAAGNTSGLGATRQFTGRNPLDGATLDRFFEVQINYDERIETARTHAAWKAAGGAEDTTPADNWLTRVRYVRRMAESESWHAIISPRASITGAALLAQDVPLDTVEHGTLLRHLTEDQRRRVK